MPIAFRREVSCLAEHGTPPEDLQVAMSEVWAVTILQCRPINILVNEANNDGRSKIQQSLWDSVAVEYGLELFPSFLSLCDT